MIFMRFACIAVLLICLLGLTIKSQAQTFNFIVDNINLSDPAVDQDDAHYNLWYAQSFTTDSAAPSYTLDALVTRLFNFTNSTNNFISVNNDASNVPGAEIGTFSNREDLGSDRFRFTPSETITLSASTQYWLIFGVTSTDPDNPPIPLNSLSIS